MFERPDPPTAISAEFALDRELTSVDPVRSREPVFVVPPIQIVDIYAARISMKGGAATITQARTIVKFIRQHFPDPAQWPADMMDRSWRLWLAQGRNPRTARQYCFAMRRFLRWARRNQYDVPTNVDIPSVGCTFTARQAIDPELLRAMLLRVAPLGEPERSAVGLHLVSGLGVTTIVNMRLDQLLIVGGRLRVTQATEHGAVPIMAPAQRWLAEYLKNDRPRLVAGHTDARQLARVYPGISTGRLAPVWAYVVQIATGINSHSTHARRIAALVKQVAKLTDAETAAMFGFRVDIPVDIESACAKLEAATVRPPWARGL